MNKIRNIKFLIIIIFGLNSCNSKTKKINSPKHITNLNFQPKNVNDNIVNEFVRVNFDLPFESSNYEELTNFKLLNSKNKVINPETDTVSKTGGHIGYHLKKGTYIYSVKTPFNEIINKEIKIQKDTELSVYNDCYQIVEKFCKNDLKYSNKINIYTTYENDNNIDNIEIDRKESNSILKIKKNGNWTKKIVKETSRMIKAINKFENKIIQLHQNKVYGNSTDYINTSQIFVKYDNKLLVLYNIKDDSIHKATNELKRNLNK